MEDYEILSYCILNSIVSFKQVYRVNLYKFSSSHIEASFFRVICGLVNQFELDDGHVRAVDYKLDSAEINYLYEMLRLFWKSRLSVHVRKYLIARLSSFATKKSVISQWNYFAYYQIQSSFLESDSIDEERLAYIVRKYCLTIERPKTDLSTSAARMRPYFESLNLFVPTKPEREYCDLLAVYYAGVRYVNMKQIGRCKFLLCHTDQRKRHEWLKGFERGKGVYSVCMSRTSAVSFIRAEILVHSYKVESNLCAIFEEDERNLSHFERNIETFYFKNYFSFRTSVSSNQVYLII